MNARESLRMLLEALAETGKKMSRQTLVDFVVGNDTTAIKKSKLGGHELFGSGGGYDEDHYSLVISKALKDRLLRQDRGMLSITSAGRKMLFSDAAEPYEVDAGGLAGPSDAAIERAQRLARQVPPAVVSPHPKKRIGHTARLRIQLIQAMDRRVPLDYFAEQNGLAFDQVLSELEEMKEGGRRFDISYFVNEVLDEPSQRELSEYLDQVDGSLARTVEEWGDVYKPEEVRLMRLVWKKR